MTQPRESGALPHDPVSAIGWAGQKWGLAGAVIALLVIGIATLGVYVGTLNSKILDAFNRSTEASVRQAIMAEQVIKIVQDEAAEDRRYRERHP